MAARGAGRCTARAELRCELQHPVAAAGHRAPGPGGAFLRPVGAGHVCRNCAAHASGWRRCGCSGVQASAAEDSAVSVNVRSGRRMIAGPTTHNSLRMELKGPGSINYAQAHSPGPRCAIDAHNQHCFTQFWSRRMLMCANITTGSPRFLLDTFQPSRWEWLFFNSTGETPPGGVMAVSAESVTLKGSGG
jgi:hypothetical protein